MKIIIITLLTIVFVDYSTKALPPIETPPLKITFSNFEPVFIFLDEGNKDILGYSEENITPKKLFSIPVFSNSECNSFSYRLSLQDDFLTIYFDQNCTEPITTIDSTKILLSQLVLNYYLGENVWIMDENPQEAVIIMGVPKEMLTIETNADWTQFSYKIEGVITREINRINEELETVNSDLQITNLKGEKVKNLTLDSEQRTVNLSDLPAGIYIFYYEVNGFPFNKKITKSI